MNSLFLRVEPTVCVGVLLRGMFLVLSIRRCASKKSRHIGVKLSWGKDNILAFWFKDDIPLCTHHCFFVQYSYPSLMPLRKS